MCNWKAGRTGPRRAAPIIHLDGQGHQHLGLSSPSAIASVPCFFLKKKTEKKNKIEASSLHARSAKLLFLLSQASPPVSPRSLIPLDLAFCFPPFLSLLLLSLSLSPSLTHTHAHTLLSLFLSAEILYLPPMTSLARGGGGRDQCAQPLRLHDFNVLNRHRKSRVHLKNTLRVLSFDVVTELPPGPPWSHSGYTLTVFLESYSDESLPSFSRNYFALSPAVSPSSPPSGSRSRPGLPFPGRPLPGGTLGRGREAAGPGQGRPCPPSVGEGAPGLRAGLELGSLRGDPGLDSSLTGLESGGSLKLGDAPGTLKMVAFSGRSRVPSGEARPPVKEIPRVGGGKAGELGGWGKLGTREEGLRERARSTGPGALGSCLPLGPTCMQVHLFSQSPALQPLSQKCPAVRSRPPRRGFRRELCQPVQSAVGPSPFPRWERGSFPSAFVPLRGLYF